MDDFSALLAADGGEDGNMDMEGLETTKQDPYQTEESTFDRGARHFKNGLFGVLYVSTFALWTVSAGGHCAAS